MDTLFLKEVNMKRTSRLSTSRMRAFSFDSSHGKELSHVPVRDYTAHKSIWSFIFPHSTTMTSAFNLFRHILEGRRFLFLYTYTYIYMLHWHWQCSSLKTLDAKGFRLRHLSTHQKIHFSFEVNTNTLKSTAYASVQIQSGVLHVRCSRWKVYLHPYSCNGTTEVVCDKVQTLQNCPSKNTARHCHKSKAILFLPKDRRNSVYWQLWDFSHAPSFLLLGFSLKIATPVPILRWGDDTLNF